MTEKTLTTENIKPALDALRGELAPWPVVAKKQDRLNTAQLNAANSGITSSLVAQIIANTAAIRALESAITGTGLRPIVVASLPAIGTQGILYIVPVTTYDPETDADVVNYSNEYIWIVAPDAPVTEGYYEQVGQTGIVINNGQLTITVNGTSVGTFTANQSGDTTAAITVPTNADYVDKTTAQSIAGVKTFSDGIVGNVTGNVTGDLTGTASKAIADEDGTSIKTGYVNIAGNQTVSGDKDWTGINSFAGLTIKDSTTLTNGNYGQALTYRDNQGNRHAYIQPYKNTSGVVNLAIGVDNSGSVQLNSSLIPYATNVLSLGSSSYQWSSVYAQTYYYNGTAWGLDKSNTWTNENIFTAEAFGQSIWLKNTTLDLSVNGNTGLSSPYQHMIHWADKNSTVYSSIQSWTSSSENSLVLRSYYRTDANTTRNLSVRFTNTATNKVIYPETNTDTELGTSTNKWKTFNGINPGALSLPDLSSDGYVDLSSNLTENVHYTYTPVVDGWLALYGQTTGFHAENAVGIFNGSGSGNQYRWACSTTSAINLLRYTTYHGAVMLPVKAGIPYLCLLTINSSTTLSSKRLYFYKAQGNV